MHHHDILNKVFEGFKEHMQSGSTDKYDLYNNINSYSYNNDYSVEAIQKGLACFNLICASFIITKEDYWDDFDRIYFQDNNTILKILDMAVKRSKAFK